MGDDNETVTFPDAIDVVSIGVLVNVENPKEPAAIKLDLSICFGKSIFYKSNFDLQFFPIGISIKSKIAVKTNQCKKVFLNQWSIEQ